MTCVSGHLTNVQFGPEHKNWYDPPPESLFSARVYTTVDEVSVYCSQGYIGLLCIHL